MGEVLSQDEIDNLLKALSTGELDADEMKNTDERQVKDYDFARPAKFSKEHLRTLEIIFEHFGRLLATNLPAYLRKSVSVDVVNSEVVIYSEFSNALSNPVLLGVVGMDPLMGNVIMEMASNLGFAIVDRLLGGVGNSLEKERDFSEIELSILERVFTICVNLLHEPWENVVEITPRLNRIETNSQFAQIISPSETIAIVTINLKIGDVEGLMNICLPYTTLEPVMDKLNTKYWFSTMKEKDSNSYEAAIENIIDNATVVSLQQEPEEEEVSVAVSVEAEPKEVFNDFDSLEKSNVISEMPNASSLFKAIINKPDDVNEASQLENILSSNENVFKAKSSIRTVEEEPELFPNHNPSVIVPKKQEEVEELIVSDDEEEEYTPTLIERVTGFSIAKRNRKKQKEMERVQEPISPSFSDDEFRQEDRLNLEIPSFLRRK